MITVQINITAAEFAAAVRGAELNGSSLTQAIINRGAPTAAPAPEPEPERKPAPAAGLFND